MIINHKYHRYEENNITQRDGMCTFYDGLYYIKTYD